MRLMAYHYIFIILKIGDFIKMFAKNNLQTFAKKRKDFLCILTKLHLEGSYNKELF